MLTRFLEAFVGLCARIIKSRLNTMPENQSSEPAESPLSAIADSDEDFDQDLGKAMGEAAKRIRTGELTEAEFYERFHDRVVEEFGFDDRPVTPTEE